MRAGLVRLRLVHALLGIAFLVPSLAEAQSFGIGPRFSFVRRTVDVDDSTRYIGALLRLRASGRTALELSLDRHTIDNDLGEHIRDMPIQTSLLFYLVQGSVAPYLLGGVGWYSREIEKLNEAGVLVSESERRFGSHAGLGGEIRMGGHVSVHLDYRYTFLHVGDQDETDTDGGAIPLPGLRAVQDKLHLSHEGSMWTTGLTFYF